MLDTIYLFKTLQENRTDNGRILQCFNLNFLWLQANLSFTPKLHSTLEHSLDHMEYFNRIEGMLEDDVEHIKQIAAKIKARVSQMKNKVLKEMYIQKLRPCSDLF